MILYRTKHGLTLAFGITLLASATHAEDNDAQLLDRLSQSKHGLREALEAVRAEGGAPISVKLELEDGKLWLSAYGAKAGLDKCAEKNELFELKGDAAADQWQPTREVFRDKEHLSRASVQLTLMQTTTLTLEAAVAKAEAAKKGVVFSAIPVLKDGKTAVAVRTRSASGQSLQILIDEKSK
jgi:hypothetical protein